MYIISIYQFCLNKAGEKRGNISSRIEKNSNRESNHSKLVQVFGHRKIHFKEIKKVIFRTDHETIMSNVYVTVPTTNGFYCRKHIAHMR